MSESEDGSNVTPGKILYTLDGNRISQSQLGNNRHILGHKFDNIDLDSSFVVVVAV